MNLEEFNVVDFHPQSGPGFVYILCWVSGEKHVSFYVGETQSIWGRLNDYYWAEFQAPTDFHVGEAVKHLHSKGLRITAKYKISNDRWKEERSIIREFREQGVQLLNDLKGYDYQTSKEDDERSKIQRYIDKLISK
jgi:hypothetical protein